MKYFLFLLCLPLSVLATPYQLKGSFLLQRGEKRPVNFSIRWVEKEGQVTGFYSDSKFTQRALVTGLSTDNGRTFEIIFPRATGEVKSLTILSASTGSSEKGKKIPLEMISRDKEGNPLTTVKFQAQFSEITSPRGQRQAQEARPCSEGFGEIAGYCGLYGGMLSEEFNSGKVCNFLDTKNIRLELDNDANVIFHTESPTDRSAREDHLIGRIPSGANSRKVDLMSRHCRPLPGTNFPGDDCKRLNLIGTFSERNGNPHFSGTYMIIDEKNDKSCRYSMTMDRVNRL